jgi:hypothetical protein
MRPQDRRKHLAAVALLFFGAAVSAAFAASAPGVDAPGANASGMKASDAKAPSAAKGAILIPQTVYVGDRATIVVPLEPSKAATIREAVIIDVSDRLPRSKDAVVLRVEFQRFEGGWRALVDFTAYAPGVVELPRIEAAGVALTGLSVPIASILDAEGGVAELSPLEGALSAPGTALLVYGTVSFLIVTVLVGAFLFLRGPALIAEALERRRRALVARSMRRVTARLAENLDTMDPSEFISILFSELRSYLTYRTGVNYIALTPREFPAAVASEPGGSTRRGVYVRLEAMDGEFLEGLFRRGDEVRFGGTMATASELRQTLDRVNAFVDKVEAVLDAVNRPSAPARGDAESRGESMTGRAAR